MGDNQHAAIRRAQRVHAIGHQLQRVDIETGIGFIENGERGLEQRHLQNFQPLFLAAGEADIQRPLQHLFGDVQRLRPSRAPACSTLKRIDFLFAARAPLRVQRGLEEIHRGDAGNFHRILHGEEHALCRALLRQPAPPDLRRDSECCRW